MNYTSYPKPMVFNGRVPLIDKCIIHYKPVSGCGVDGESNETHITLFSLIGYSSKNAAEYILIDQAKLKDFAKTGFSGYTGATVIPAGNASGLITALICDISSQKKCEHVYFKFESSEFLNELLQVELITNVNSSIYIPSDLSVSVVGSPSGATQQAVYSLTPALTGLLEENFRTEDSDGNELTVSNFLDNDDGTYTFTFSEGSLVDGNVYYVYVASEQYDYDTIISFRAVA